MDSIELQNIWKSYDQKMEHMLAINKEVAIHLTRQKFNTQMSRFYLPKWIAVLIGLPYTLLLIAVTTIACLAKAYFVALGFGAIALIMIALLLTYFHQLYLIRQVKNNENILSTQQQLSKLRISSFRSLNLAVFQLPFWSICWVSVAAVEESPFLYGGINLLLFLLLTAAAYWLYQKLSYKNKDSKIRDFFLSGSEWEPIVKSAEILEQIKEYEK
ncbi:hypothetical protein N9954_08030 [Maribacter sp.]|nr:hypothetical protein [Maribacter sp.]